MDLPLPKRLDLSPPKRKRREETPTTPDARKRKHDWAPARVALEVGALAATTARHMKFANAEQYGPLLGPAPAGDWLVLEEAPRRALQATLIGIDVEMCERRSDKKRFPLSAAIVACRFEESRGGFVEEVLFEGLLEPGEELKWWENKEAFEWKDEIHGLSREAHALKRLNGELTTLKAVQEVVRRHWDDMTFLVGHKLSADLAVLKVRGPVLRRRCVDTMLLHMAPAGSAPSLDSLAPAAMKRDPRHHHNATDDAVATLRVVQMDLANALDSLSAPLAPGRNAPQPTAAAAGDSTPDASNAPKGGGAMPAKAAAKNTTAVVDVPEKLVGKLIGKKGANFEKLRALCSPAGLQLSSQSEMAGAPRTLSLRALTVEGVSAALTALEKAAPDLAPHVQAARAALAASDDANQPRHRRGSACSE
ncbi:hypothetical protein M885DRAFT_618385 [Pelagophyceae sp. CCMP2097]|nr:hypothetical protein M885DRAFT_618385 [Pelagophyceae sp. CCMP2097]